MCFKTYQISIIIFIFYLQIHYLAIKFHKYVQQEYEYKYEQEKNVIE